MGMKIITFITNAELADDCNAGYLYIQPNRKGEACVAVKSVPIMNGAMTLDFDKDGRLFGIEFLEASQHMPKFILDAKIND